MAASTITLSNRRENLRPLLDFVHHWAQERNLSPARQSSLELAVRKVFRQLLSHAYPQGQPGSIAVALEEQGPRVRLIFEDDAPPHNLLSYQGVTDPGNQNRTNADPDLGQLQQLADSLIYCRTPDRKNRLVIFIS